MDGHSVLLPSHAAASMHGDVGGLAEGERECVCMTGRHKISLLLIVCRV